MTGGLFTDLPLARPTTSTEWRPPAWAWGDLAPGSYEVIVADPPWRFELRSDAGEGKAPQAQYACQDLDWVKALPVKALARPDALLFLWACWPMVDQALAVTTAWGFTFVSGGSWAKRTASGKLRWGPGYIIRTTEEPMLLSVDDASDPFLVGKTGDGFRNPSLPNHIDGLARGHSRKPDEFYEALAAATPGRRRCNLFSGRHEQEGFEGWGHDHRAARDWEGMIR